MTKSKNIGRGGKRPGAGRPRKLRSPPPELIEPDLVLRQIASDPLQPASARVAAAKALLAAERGDKPPSPRVSDLERRTLEIMNRGKPN